MAQWRVDGGAWNDSGATVQSLVAGNHTLEYKDVTGWTKPASKTVTITNGQNTPETGTYTQQGGSLKVTVYSENWGAIDAKWMVDGGTWQTSGAIVSNLSVGNHTVSFSDVTGWITPASQTVAIQDGVFKTTYGVYYQQTGSLQVTLSPVNAIVSGAKWQVDGGAWNDNYAVVSNLSLGNHTVSFKPVTGWETPANQTVKIEYGKTATVTGTYIEQIGSLTVNILPQEAVTAGAKWRIGNGDWQNSGATISDISLGYGGQVSVNFKFVDGWRTPGWGTSTSQTVTIQNGQPTIITGTYTQMIGSLTVDISPSSVIPSGAKWRVDGGAWQDNGATVPNLRAQFYDNLITNVGRHTVSFKSVANWTTPVNQTITVKDGRTITLTGTYEPLGSLQVTILPSAAITEGARWFIDDYGASFNNSGATLNISIGTHTLYFHDIDNWGQGC